MPRLIESDAFPFEFLSALAERESWRKEIHRPIYHMHKWWAKRLGSVFRGIILGCLLPDGGDLQNAFYGEHAFSDVVVFDPFMGSGTTVGEAHKLGCTAVGRDINPVACESVRVALGPLDKKKLIQAFEGLSATVGERIRELYPTRPTNGVFCERALLLLGEASRLSPVRTTGRSLSEPYICEKRLSEPEARGSGLLSAVRRHLRGSPWRPTGEVPLVPGVV